jgi:hypothetical protein
MIDGVEKGLDVGFNDPNVFLPDFILQVFYRLPRRAAWTVGITAIQKQRLKQGFQYPAGKVLDDLVLKHRYAQRPLTAVGFGNEHSFYQFCVIPLVFQPFFKIEHVALQVLTVFLIYYPVNAGRRVLVQFAIRLLK